MLKSRVLALAVAAVSFAAFAPFAAAQPADPPAAGDGDGDGDGDGELTDEQKQEKAKVLFTEGAELEKAKDYTGAIAKWKEAFELFPDPGLWARIGQAYQVKGSVDNDFDAIKKAIEAYEKYLELDPNPDEATLTELNNRIGVLQKALDDEDERKKKEGEEAKQQKLEEERARLEEEARKKKEKDELEGMRPAFDGMVIAGLDQDAAAAARVLAGGFLGFGAFALEAHVAFEGFFRVAGDKGLSGRSLTVIDLGVRVGAGTSNYTGFFVSAGGGFGLFGGKPRERKLSDDTETCEGFDDPSDPGSCTFDVDKNITGRLGIGYGFAANRKTTVAARLDFTYWLLSVDGEQGMDAVPAARVAKPQQSFSVLVGLEFMRWL